MTVNVEKRFLALFLAFVMVFLMLPWSTVEVHAALMSDVTVDRLTVKHTSQGNTGGFTFNDSTLTVYETATSSDNCGSTSYTAQTTKVTLTNGTGADVKLTFTGSLTNGGSATIGGTSFSPGMSKELANGDSIEIAVTSSGSNANQTTLTLTIAREAATNVTTTFSASQNGSYTVDGVAITAETNKPNTAAKVYALVATPASGYQFFGWYSTAAEGYVSYSATDSLQFNKDTTVYPVFVLATTALFGVGTAKYDNLTNAANAAAAGSTKTVVLLNNGTLTGSHTIPSGVTLLIPFDDANSIYTTVPRRPSVKASSMGMEYDSGTYTAPSQYRMLTMESGASITVKGSLNVGGSQSAKMGNNGAVTGPYGRIHMKDGSSISIEDGATLYAWGYITGSGNVVAKNGSTVYESFQLMDYRGGDMTSGIAKNEYGVFPMSQYYIQNIEVLLTLEAGAKEFGYMSVTVTLAGIQGTSVPIISGSGGGAMFQLSSGYITKDFDESTGRLVFTINGNVSVSAIDMSLKVAAIGTVNINSSNFNLPIPGHMSVEAIGNSKVSIDQDLALLPGSVLEIGADVECTLVDGTRVIVYDWDDWGGYCSQYDSEFRPLSYAPGRTNSTETVLVNEVATAVSGVYVVGRANSDATVIIDGTIYAQNGAVYTTSHGANIYTNGTGKIVASIGTEKITYQVKQNGTEVEAWPQISIVSAILQNGNGTILETDGLESGKVYGFVYDAELKQWVCTDKIGEITFTGSRNCST